jgi:hypothetical protein
VDTNDHLQPTFRGYLKTTYDALLLFEACLAGQLPPVHCRPLASERPKVIRSGPVFINAEDESGIKRWTDGVLWSPSRKLGNFLVYRKPSSRVSKGEQERAVKEIVRADTPKEFHLCIADEKEPEQYPTESSATNRAIEQLVRSLASSYDVKEQGLNKKTISVELRGTRHHLISCYRAEDVLCGRLVQPSQLESLQHVLPQHSLLRRWKDLKAMMPAARDNLRGTRPGMS